MATMAQVKEWILTKCREAPIVLHQEGGVSLSPRFHNVIVTPDNIPAFTIPLTQRSDPGPPASQSDSENDLSFSSASLSSGGVCADISPQTCTLQAPIHSGYAKSAPVSPSPTWAGSRVRQDSASYNDIDKFRETNVDPHSMRAMGLAHFKTKTSFGFDTLAEAPHTRRKESLFFDDTTPSTLNRLASRSLQNCRLQPVTGNETPNQSPRQIRRQIPCVVAPLGVLPPPQQWAVDAESLPTTPERHHPQYRRRRSSSSGLHDSDDDEELASSMEPSPLLLRRRNSGSSVLNNKNLNRLIPKKQKQFRRSCSLDAKEAPLGEIKLSVQYCPEQKQIKVILLKVDNLDTTSQGSYFVKLYLSPGKLQKQSTTCLKNTNLINESFCFRNLDYNQVRRMTLHLKVMVKEGSLSRRPIGQAQVNFADLSLLQETRLWKCLEPSSQTLGQVTVSACFEACAQKLSVEVLEASHLRRGYLRGAPDPYIRLELQQPGRPAIRCQTKVRRSTTTPVYSEEFVLDISPKIEDLTYTSLTLTVYDRVHLRHDAPLGTVRLGYGASEASQVAHWNRVLQNPGRAYIESHMLGQIE